MIYELLETKRILVDSDGGFVKSKRDALRLLANMLGTAVDVAPDSLERMLTERERLVSTAIGDGVAVPHTSVDSVQRQAAALLLCPNGVPFDAIDRAPVKIILGVIGPKNAAGDHLRTLARVSRLLRDGATRDKLVSSSDSEAAFEFIQTEDKKLG